MQLPAKRHDISYLIKYTVVIQRFAEYAVINVADPVLLKTIADLQALVAQQAAIIEQQAALIKAQALQIEKLSFELAVLKKQLFGRSREAADLLSVQGQLFAPLQTIEVDSATVLPAPVLARTPKSQDLPRRQPKREILPPNLPREERILDVPEATELGLIQIGQDVSERLAYRPGQHYVLRTIRPRYADPRNRAAGVQQISAPPCVIPGGILDDSVIADVAISKFADHLPLSRQIDRFSRLGVEVSLSTLSENLLTVATLWLKPLIDALWQVLKQRTSLHADETILPTLPEPGSALGCTQKTRLWTYLNDTGPPIILFHYTDTKAGAHVESVLANWSDPASMQPHRVCYLHADAASNYEALYRKNPGIKAVNCWAHARRKFYAIAHESPIRIFAHDAVEQIDILFAFERAWKPLSSDTRHTMRQTQAKPQLAHIHAMMQDKLAGLSPNSATAKAISYLLKRWDNFTRYLERPDLQLSNNAAERALRKAALGRKNFLFVGNARAGEAAAIYYSLIETAKANGIEPTQWLLRAMREMPTRKTSNFNDVKDLLPITGADQL